MRNSSSHAYTLSCPSKEEALALQGTTGFSFHFVSFHFVSFHYFGKRLDSLRPVQVPTHSM